MTRLVAILVLASGCFYTDPINERPSLSIRQTMDGPIYRGDTVDLKAVTSDPQNADVSLSWSVFTCTDATPDANGAHSGCDPAPHFTSTDMIESFVVPPVRADGQTPVKSVYVTLAGQDVLGAAAKPLQELILAIVDKAPDLALRADSRYAYVVGVGIDLFAKVGDDDDGPSTLAPLDWQVFPPSALAELVVMQDPNDPKHVQFGKVFTPPTIGDWDIQVTATDPFDISTVQHLPITVVADHAPCLEQWAPITPVVATDALPLSDPTLFQVLVVQDDLDPFPSVPSDPILGDTAFSWSILPPGSATRQALAGVSGNAVELDPASYTPGDVVELRVEIQDRNHTPVNCPDGDLTCSTISDPTCIQRLTWRVEVQ